MEHYHVKLRYYPDDPLEEITEQDLKVIAEKYAVQIELERIDNREPKDGLLMEETLDKPLEAITQDVISITADNEDSLRNCLIAVYKKYRSPRTVYSFVGSSKEGSRIARSLIDKYGGW